MRKKSNISKNTPVTTYGGKTRLRGEVRYIRGKYYIPNEECFLIDGQWYRINSGKILYDHEYKRWRLISESTYVRGVVGIDPSKDSPFILGDFSPSDKNIDVAIGMLQHRVVKCLSKDILTNSPIAFEESPQDLFFSPDLIIKPEIVRHYRSIPPIENRSSFYHSIPYDYGAAPNIPEFTQHFERGFVTPYVKEEYKDNLVNLPYSFGVEFETNRGAIPERYLRQNGLIPCRDGSIAGFEYVTIPLHGPIGISALYRHCNLLRKYCRLSHMDSLHIHLGGFPRTKKSIMALYKICTLLQKEIYKMFPYTYKDTSSFKRRNYCSPLTYIPSKTTAPYNFDKLFYHLIGGEIHGLPAEVTTENHPHDRSGQHKWNINHRYKIVNFVPIIWGERGTVEFRVHTPTMDFDKVVYWLYICSAILKYAEKHTDYLLGRTTEAMRDISLKDVITDGIYSNSLSNLILDYIKLRKEWYSNQNDMRGEDEVAFENSPNVRFGSYPIRNIKPLIQFVDE